MKKSIILWLAASAVVMLAFPWLAVKLIGVIFVLVSILILV